MAPKKKVAPKKSAKQGASSVDSLQNLRLFCGYFLVVFSIVALLALVSRSYGGARGNWMGPYLGEALAVNLGILFGRLPTVIVVVASGLSGIRLLLGQRVAVLLRISLGLWSLLILVSLLLTLRIAEVQSVSRLHLEQNGGLLGVFLVKQLVEPAFGLSRVAPAILGIMGVILTLVIAFGLRLRHFDPVVQWIKAMSERAPKQVPPTRSVTVTPTLPVTPLHRNEDTSDFPILRRNKVAPFNATATEESFEPKRVVNPVPNPAPLTMPIPAPNAVPITPAQQNAAIRDIERALLNAQNMDPREVRRLRDELADLRRIHEMNDWEDRKAGKMSIDGIIKSEDVDATVIAKVPVPPAPQAPPQMVTPIKPIKPEVQIEERTVASIQMPVAEEPRGPIFRDDEVFGEHSGEYRIPKASQVLGVVPDQPIDYTPDELKQFGAMLEQQLENFRVKGKVVHIATGPVITRFEIEPGPGVKVSRFAGLSDDLALALKAHSIRVLAPIPGKSVVGIEIPNRKAQTVFCREILESPRFLPDPYTLQIVLGKDIMGNAFVMDLARAPHLLIAGQTGSGKSVCINTLMASLLFSKSPDDLRMILVDPKVVELKSYEKIPHLLHPVVTDPNTAVQALQWACFEMDRRYEILAKAGVRNISGFNQKLVKGELDSNEQLDPKDKQRMPFIVIVVDEFADVIMQAKKEFEDPVIRLAQKARAAGMHMVLATQRPSTNVITGIIKANLPTRISFKVASHIDARTVLDHAGAEKLLGRGDMLFRSIDDPEPIRVHGAFLTDNEAEQVAKACSEQEVHYPQLSSFLVAGPDQDGGPDPMDAPDQDALFWDAAELCVLQGGGSTSLLQRRFSIGYSRAGRIMDSLFRAGVVGPERGSKPRECLLSADDIAQLRRTRGA